MILISKLAPDFKDNPVETLNLDMCLGTANFDGGLLVHMPEGRTYMIRNYSLAKLEKETQGRWGNLLILQHDYEEWTTTKHAAALKRRAHVGNVPLPVIGA